jgi:superfamily II DNA or RNA helicase
VSPWSTWPVVVASIDYVKRPEVLRAALDGRWDIVIVDEAHRVANDGDRRQAESALASLAGYVVLLATALS